MPKYLVSTYETLFYLRKEIEAKTPEEAEEIYLKMRYKKLQVKNIVSERTIFFLLLYRKKRIIVPINRLSHMKKPNFSQVVVNEYVCWIVWTKTTPLLTDVFRPSRFPKNETGIEKRSNLWPWDTKML